MAVRGVHWMEQIWRGPDRRCVATSTKRLAKLCEGLFPERGGEPSEPGNSGLTNRQEEVDSSEVRRLFSCTG